AADAHSCEVSEERLIARRGCASESCSGTRRRHAEWWPAVHAEGVPHSSQGSQARAEGERRRPLVCGDKWIDLEEVAEIDAPRPLRGRHITAIRSRGLRGSLRLPLRPLATTRHAFGVQFGKTLTRTRTTTLG